MSPSCLVKVKAYVHLSGASCYRLGFANASALCVRLTRCFYLGVNGMHELMTDS